MEDELNSLIDQFRIYIDKIRGTNESDLFTNFYDDATMRLVEPWVRNKFNKKSIKCSIKARKYREDGNNHFKVGCNIPALVNYTKSIIYAPFNSLEFNLAVGNRSAALYHLGKLEECIQDLELCLDTLNYPENKKFKLYQRLIQSYIDLKQGLKAKETYGKLLKYLDEVERFPDEFDDKQILKLNQTARNLNELIEIIVGETTKLELGQNDLWSGFKENKCFKSASDLITLKFDRKKGRYVEAACDIKHGDILFIEKTLCFVPILKDEALNDFNNVCYNCFQETCAPIPCNNCDELYCSLSCKIESWTRYHLFECVGSSSEIWKNIGVNFLAFRIFLFGFQSGLFNFQIDKGNVEVFREPDGAWYKMVCSLVSNVDRMGPLELLPHLVSTLIIVSYLKDMTGFFPALRDKYGAYGAKSDAEIARVTGAVLLRHILQVICNASIIEGVHEDFYRKFNSAEEIKESGMFVQGTGLFPSVSLMNHSCDSNVTNYFLRDTVIVKANRSIKRGEEVLNCYGHDCRSESTPERKASLQFQYYFECCCSACLKPSRPEMYENNYRCPKCNNCSLNTDGVQIARCLACRHEFKPELQTTSEKLYKKWKLTKDVKYLEQCFQIEENIYYKYNYKLYDLIQDLQTYYKNTGRFPEWWKYTEMLLDLDKRIYGCCSLKYGLNTRETLIRLLTKFQTRTEKLGMLDRVQAMLQDSKEIFELYYPKSKLRYDFISRAFEKLQTKICNT